jgi:hypothetical protein
VVYDDDDDDDGSGCIGGSTAFYYWIANPSAQTEGRAFIIIMNVFWVWINDHGFLLSGQVQNFGKERKRERKKER